MSSRDLEETKAALQKLQSPFDEEHWYWGAFLRSTGELTGEGGLLDTEGLVNESVHLTFSKALLIISDNPETKGTHARAGQKSISW